MAPDTVDALFLTNRVHICEVEVDLKGKSDNCGTNNILKVLKPKTQTSLKDRMITNLGFCRPQGF